MHAIDWLRDAGKKPGQPVYVVFGGDSYLVRESIAAVARAVFPEGDADAGTTRFAGGQATLADVRDELFTLPFFSRRRLVVVEEADAFVTKHRKDLEAYVVNPSASGTLLLQVKTWTATTNLAKLVDKVGVAIDCGALGERQSSKVIAWLTDYARKRCDAQLESAAANLLVELVGLEIGILAAEIEKLAVYAGDSKRIERADVARMVDAGRVETVWKVLDAATTGQAAPALELLDNLVAAGEFPVMLLAAMSASLLKVHHAGRFAQPECPWMRRVVSRESRRSRSRRPASSMPTWAQGACDGLPATLLRADLDLKGGSSQPPRAVLEVLLATLSRPRTD